MSGEPIWITDEAGVMATPPVAQPASAPVKKAECGEAGRELEPRVHP